MNRFKPDPTPAACCRWALAGVVIASVLAATLAVPAVAADRIKIGFLSTMSGQNAMIGNDVRDSFMLALKLNDNKLGGLPVEVVVADDAQNPETGKQAADRLIKRDKVDLITGPIFSNVLLAMAPQILASETFLISPNAGPSALAGAQCNKFFFSAKYQNDGEAEAMGKYVADKQFKNVYLLAPNYPSGKEHIAGFKRFYGGGVAGETLTKLGQVDYAVEIAQIRAARPDALFYMLPGGMGINFLKQAGQAGLTKELALFGPGSTLDDDVIKVVGDVVEGVFNTSSWAPDLDNAANRRFMAEFQKAHGRIPTGYGSVGYDTAFLIDSAIKAVGGRIEDKDAFRAALKAAKFESVRGAFKFADNQFPVQDYYLRQVTKDDKGVFYNKTIAPVLKQHSDVYGAECKMPS